MSHEYTSTIPEELLQTARRIDPIPRLSALRDCGSRLLVVTPSEDLDIGAGDEVLAVNGEPMGTIMRFASQPDPVPDGLSRRYRAVAIWFWPVTSICAARKPRRAATDLAVVASQ